MPPSGMEDRLAGKRVHLPGRRESARRLDLRAAECAGRGRQAALAPPLGLAHGVVGLASRRSLAD